MTERIIQTVYAEAKQKLQHAGCDAYALDARLLICHVLNLSSEQFVLAAHNTVSDAQMHMIDELLAQRALGKPVAKIIGRKEFYGRDFITTTDTLDPRPDTEILIETCLNVLPRDRTARVLDLGTGTGCIAVTLLAECKLAHGVAVDASQAALAVAQRNAQRHGIADRLQCVHSDWFGSVTGQFDLIVSNPPYIPHADIATLATDVRDYDPMSALDGGDDGLDPYRLIIPQSRDFFGESGWLAFEVGIHQADDVAALMAQNGFDGLRISDDLAGIARVVCGKWTQKR